MPLLQPKRNNEAFRHDTAGWISAFAQKKSRPFHPLGCGRGSQRKSSFFSEKRGLRSYGSKISQRKERMKGGRRKGKMRGREEEGKGGRKEEKEERGKKDGEKEGS